MFSNKYISILGDSISTFKDVSNNTSYNSTIGNNRIYYGRDDHLDPIFVVDVNDTWFQIVLNKTNLKLCVNNSWSGWLVLDSDSNACGYGSRTDNLHNDHNNQMPDIIAIYLGTNDAHHKEVEIKPYNKKEIDDFINSNNKPTNFNEAYALMLFNIKRNYPKAKLFGFTLLHFECLSKETNKIYYEVMVSLLKHFNVTIVDLHSDCKVTPSFDYFAESAFVHPNKYGMNEIANTFINVLKETYYYDK